MKYWWFGQSASKRTGSFRVTALRKMKPREGLRVCVRKGLVWIKRLEKAFLSRVLQEEREPYRFHVQRPWGGCARPKRGQCSWRVWRS